MQMTVVKLAIRHAFYRTQMFITMCTKAPQSMFLAQGVRPSFTPIFIHSQALIVDDGPLAYLLGFLDHTHTDTR
jgi:hypothetical protein